jgi:N utilization substance protein A
VRHKGVLDGFEVGKKEAEDLILSARVLAGWITAEDLSAGDTDEGAEAGSEPDDASAET